MQTTGVRLLAAGMGVTHCVTWILLRGWERPGRTARLRARLDPPPLLARTAYAALVIPSLYPGVVAIAPRWGYDGPSNWSSPIDLALLGIGVGLWAAGVSTLLQAGRVLGGYMDVDGVTEDHQLVASGPYRYVRHPIYGSFTAISAGLGLAFRSYLLAGVAAAWFAAASWGTAAEETLLTSSEGFDDAYRSYRERTGRFLPRLRQRRGFSPPEA